MGQPEVCDCRCFHKEIEEDSWHRAIPRLQTTWKSLILLLMTFHGQSPNSDARRAYQRDQWGRSHGETCVIELSGLAARNLCMPADHKSHCEHRIATIRERLLGQDNPPAFVVMYGKSDHSNWEKIVGQALELDVPVMRDGTVFVSLLHPNTHGLTNQYWINWGQHLRKIVKTPSV